MRIILLNAVTCVACFAAAEAATQAVVAPGISVQPASKTVTAPATATFSVTATGTAPLTYQWSKKGTAITGATSASYTTPATSTADSGATFTVTVKNSANSVTSKPATLTVNPAPVAPSISTQPASTTVTAPTKATFSVAVTGTAPLAYQWSKRGAAISGATSASYTTPATTTADNNATFAVTIKNAVGSATSNPATLTVNPTPVAPTISSQPQSAMVTAPAAATFSVTVTGTAPLTYQWSKNGTPIGGANSSSYTTPATTTIDTGATFTVIVTNSAGSVTSKPATLTVQGPAIAPTILIQPSDVTVTLPATATFRVTATGTPPLTYEWFFGGLAVKGGPNSPTYTTPPTTYDDNGNQYRVTVKNSAGSTYSGWGTLTVISPPDFTIDAFNQISGYPLYTGLVLQPSSSFAFLVETSAISGLSKPINVSITGAPAGVTFSPSSFTLQPGASQPVVVSATFAAASSSAGITSTITVAGVGGNLKHQFAFPLDMISASLNISVQPVHLDVPAGGTASLDIQVDGNGIGGSQGTGSINVQLTTTATGVKFTPSSFLTYGSGGMATVFVEGTNGATPGQFSANATYGPLKASAAGYFNINGGSGSMPVPFNTAQQIVHTDAVTPYASFPPVNYLVYHNGTDRFFFTDAFKNQLNVVDASAHKLLGSLDIPGAFGLDQAPDGSVLYVGTMVGDMYVVDPIKMAILKRYPTGEIGPTGFPAHAVYALADGKMLLEYYDLRKWPDAFELTYPGPLAVWDPATNDLHVLGAVDRFPATLPVTPSCTILTGNVLLSKDRSRVFLTSVPGDTKGPRICSLDPETGVWNWSAQLGDNFRVGLGSLVLTADGSTLVGYDQYNFYIVDAATLAVKVTSSMQDPSKWGITSSLLLSPDGSKIYLTDPNQPDVMWVFDSETFKSPGWIPQPNLPSENPNANNNPLYQAMTPGGLAAGVIQSGGLALLDTTAVHSFPVAYGLVATRLDVPYGPVGGGTGTSFWANADYAPALGSIYFGAHPATGIENNTITGVTAVTPAGSPGPVDVRMMTADGGVELLPLGFTYGPYVTEAVTAYSTAEGGGPASISGFGFGPQVNFGGIDTDSIPLDLKITVGGANAAITSADSNPYLVNSRFIDAPYPYNAAVYTVPPGPAGSTSSITVSNASGSTTAATKMTYLPAVQKFPVTGELVDGIYDSKRNVYYFSDVNQVRVFSLAKAAWLSSIPIPAPKGAYGPQRLWGLGLSPDGSKLAVTDPGAFAIYVVNPDQPSSLQSFAFTSQNPIFLGSWTPAGVAITNSGMIYFAAFDTDGDGSAVLYTLDPSTGKISEVSPTPQSDGPYPYEHLAITSDGSRVYYNNGTFIYPYGGEVGWIDTASGKVVEPFSAYGNLQLGTFELALSPDQTRIYSNGFITDSNINAAGMANLNLAEGIDADYVTGAVFSADGRLVFQPGVQFIDVYDGNTGSFRTRISLPIQLSPNYQALVANNQDNRLVAITGETGNGIAVINLNSIPEPPAYPYLPALASPPTSVDFSAFQPPASPKVAAKAPSAAKTGPRIHYRANPLFTSRIRGAGQTAAEPSQP
jgi:hypothetical protein